MSSGAFALLFGGFMRKLDLIGRNFNRLTVIEEVASSEKDSRWLCQCECGNLVEVRGNAIKNATTKSCGCLARETAKIVAKKNNIETLGHRGYDSKRVDGIATFLINEKVQKNNKTGYNGVKAYNLADGSVRYMAYLTVGKKRYAKKGFKTAEEAHQYRLALVDKYVPKENNDEV